MDDSGARTETCGIVEGDVGVERTVEYRDSGVIVTSNVEARGSRPAAFTLIESFPDELPVADSGFRPGDEPADGSIDADGAVVKGVVEPGEGCTFVYALKFFEAVPDPELDIGEPELIASGEPPGEPRAGSGVLARGGTTGASPPSSAVTGPGSRSTTDPAEPEHEPMTDTTEPEAEAEPEPRAESNTDTTEPDPDPDAEPELRAEPDPDAEPGMEPRSGTTTDATGNGSRSGTIGATLGLFEGDRRSDSGETATDGRSRTGRLSIDTDRVSNERNGTADGSDDAADGSDDAADGSDEVGGHRQPSEGRDPGRSVVDTTGSDDAPEGGVVSALVTELRDGSASDEELAAIRRALGVDGAASDGVRIEHLQARVGEFEAYAEALEGVIDEHGTAEEFVGRFEDRLDGLRDDLGAVEAELSATRETVSAVETRLETLADDLEALEERTEADLEAIHEEVDDRHGANAEAVESLRERVEAVEAFRDEFSSVFAEMDRTRDR